MAWFCNIMLIPLLALLSPGNKRHEVTAVELISEIKQQLLVNNNDYVEKRQRRNQLSPSGKGKVDHAKEDKNLRRYVNPYGLAVHWGDSRSGEQTDSDSDSSTYNAMTYTPAMRAVTGKLSEFKKHTRDTRRDQSHHKNTETLEEKRIKKIKKLKKFVDNNKDLLGDVVDINKLDELTGSFSPPPKIIPERSNTINSTSKHKIHVKKNEKNYVSNEIMSIKNQIRELFSTTTTKNSKSSSPLPFGHSAIQPFPLIMSQVNKFQNRKAHPGDKFNAEEFMFTKGRLVKDKEVFFGVKAPRSYALRLGEIPDHHDKIPKERLKSSTRDPRDFDLAPAIGGRITVLRNKGRICQRNVLIPEGPKYDSKGIVYLNAFKPKPGAHLNYSRTIAPDLVLPKCCNCCKKSVLGCE